MPEKRLFRVLRRSNSHTLIGTQNILQNGSRAEISRHRDIREAPEPPYMPPHPMNATARRPGRSFARPNMRRGEAPAPGLPPPHVPRLPENPESRESRKSPAISPRVVRRRRPRSRPPRAAVWACRPSWRTCRSPRPALGDRESRRPSRAPARTDPSCRNSSCPKTAI